nr:transporter substrate-binding domain-containing protein [uncultured Albidiferax sp.]
MTLSVFARRTLCRRIGAAALALAVGPVVAQQVLQIGRVDVPSPLAAVAEGVMKEAFKRSGLSAEFKGMPLARSIIMADEGRLDGELVRIADAVKTYPNLVAVPTPVVWLDVGIYSLDEKLVHLPRAELRAHTVGVTRGTLILTKYSQGMHVTDAHNVAAALDMLTHGRFDIAMMIYIDGELGIARQQLQGIYRRPRYWASEPLYFYLNKKHAALVPRINTALQAMQKEGLLKKAFQDKLAELGITPLQPAD